MLRKPMLSIRRIDFFYFRSPQASAISDANKLEQRRNT